jgi:hypothetical protein
MLRRLLVHMEWGDRYKVVKSILAHEVGFGDLMTHD